MNRRVYLMVVCVLAAGWALGGSAGTAQAQSFVGKWVHQGPRGASVLEFFPGEKKVVGPTRGTFRHQIYLDDGRVIQGDGYYVFRSVLPNRGWLTLHFADGHVTQEHEHTTASTVLSVRHHGITRNYVRQ
jgi:hypothetical protein